jgi:hypothetical protein
VLLTNKKYLCAAQKSPLLFRAALWNKQKYFNAFALLWDDTKSTNCPGRAGFAKARYMKSFSFYQLGMTFFNLLHPSISLNVRIITFLDGFSCPTKKVP